MSERTRKSKTCAGCGGDAGDEQTWRELAAREYEAAQHGREAWYAFVRECEQQLDHSWWFIRRRFNEIHKTVPGSPVSEEKP